MQGRKRNSREKQRANGPPVCTQTGGPLALNIFKLHHPARWAGLGKLLGLRPEILEKTQPSNASNELLDKAGLPWTFELDSFTIRQEGSYQVKMTW